MTAIPTTDQILANLVDLGREAEACKLITAKLRDDADTFTQRLTDSLPGVDPAIAGEVLVRTADVFGMFATWGNQQPLSDEALVAVWMLGEVGRRLYCGGEQVGS